MSDSRIYICSDGHRLAYGLWIPENREAKAFVQIIHGLAECSGKYEQLAKYLNKKGYAVFAADLRGHGNTAEEGEQGVFAEQNGWNRINEDSFEISRYISTLYHAKQIFLLGYGLGSTIARTVIMQHPDFYAGVIAVDSEASMGIKGKVEQLVCKLTIKKRGFDYPCKKLDENFGTVSLYADVLEGIAVANSGKKVAGLPKDLPILLMSGAQKKDTDSVFETYRSAGIVDLEKKIFESDKKVFNDMLHSWIELHI